MELRSNGFHRKEPRRCRHQQGDRLQQTEQPAALGHGRGDRRSPAIPQGSVFLHRSVYDAGSVGGNRPHSHPQADQQGHAGRGPRYEPVRSAVQNQVPPPGGTRDPGAREAREKAVAGPGELRAGLAVPGAHPRRGVRPENPVQAGAHHLVPGQGGGPGGRDHAQDAPSLRDGPRARRAGPEQPVHGHGALSRRGAPVADAERSQESHGGRGDQVLRGLHPGGALLHAPSGVRVPRPEGRERPAGQGRLLRDRRSRIRQARSAQDLHLLRDPDFYLPGGPPE
mmetsp:Transcript_13103/g.30865  ORF Transcript_13103/g.30865 Transcript_13103/m.30865 type:complete len:282 (+) Transcript_13103:1336-2181(+)